jgi:diadenosine tetraphosphate (Ap4A) HIT family hydrolase
MPTLIHQRVSEARVGKNPAVICQMPSGWAVLCDMQYLRGYSILLPDPVVPGLNELNQDQRARYLLDMALLGDALLEVTGSYRINYAIFCNTEPALHAHVIPRYLSEPEDMRKGPPFLYDLAYQNSIKFDYDRDKELMELIATAIKKHL